MYGATIRFTFVLCHCVRLIAAYKPKVHNPTRASGSRKGAYTFPNQTFVISDGSSFEFSISSQDIQGDGFLGPVLSAQGDFRNFTAAEYYAELESVSGEERLRMALANLNQTKAMLNTFVNPSPTTSLSLSPRAETWHGNVSTLRLCLFTSLPGLFGLVSFSIMKHWADVNVPQRAGFHDLMESQIYIALVFFVLPPAAILINRLLVSLEAGRAISSMGVLVLHVFKEVIRVWTESAQAIGNAATRSGQRQSDDRQPSESLGAPIKEIVISESVPTIFEAYSNY